MVKKKDADVEDVEENREQMPIRPQPSKIQVVVLTLGLSLLVLFAPLPRLNGQTDIIPDGIWPMDVGTVDWKACADVDDIPGSECGYIIVPKDYFDPSAGTASIALGRLRASSKNSKGTVLFNPGGPGGAGKPFVTKRGNLLQNYIGEEYDLVGFDPRGIGETLPKVQCFSKDFSFGNFKRNTVLERSYDFAPNGTFEEIREVLLVQQRESNSLLETTFDVCRETMGEELKYMGTATVVRDMDYITAALDGPDALINFYGGSYGSILGQYLVNMLPDRIGRVAIDGIADAVAWSEKPSYQWYRQWLVSSENNYDQFVDGCSATGRPACPLARHKGENPSLIKDRIESFINELYYNPLPVPHARLPGVLTSGRARGYVQLLLQRPITWPKAAFDIASAINGDGSFILNAMEPNMYRDLERSAVSCNDNPPLALANVRPEDVVDELLYVYQNVSHFVFNVVTAEPDAGCQFWPVTPPERFQGPWNNTLSNPILVLSNTEDPVTPMDSALKVQDLLGESARLLLQDGPGHVTLALPSFCTASHVQAFFSNGTLPPKGTVCKPDVTPFPTVTDHSILYSSDQEQILMSMTSLHDAMMDAVSPYKAPPTVCMTKGQGIDGKCVKSESGKVAQVVKFPTAMLRPAQSANDWSVSGVSNVLANRFNALTRLLW